MPYPFFVVYSPAYNVDIGPHVFKTDKYRLIMGKLAKVLDLSDDRILTPEPAPPESLLSALDPAYYDDLIHCRQTWRTISAELPINREIIDSVLICAGGSILAARKAIECHGVVFHNGGGWHHAFRDHAEGFCYINDVALAILAMKHEEKICKAMVIDLDLHQGNGTAVYFQDDPDVFTFSMHQQQLYPVKRKSELDIGLKNFADDTIYLRHLQSAIPRIYDEHKPEFIVYVAGADPYKDDQLGNLQLTKEGLQSRDALVLNEAADRGIPVMITLAGGYAIDLRDTVEIHVNTAVAAFEASRRYPVEIAHGSRR